MRIEENERISGNKRTESRDDRGREEEEEEEEEREREHAQIALRKGVSNPWFCGEYMNIVRAQYNYKPTSQQ
jgi:hypothetical protein